MGSERLHGQAKHEKRGQRRDKEAKRETKRKKRLEQRKSSENDHPKVETVRETPETGTIFVRHGGKLIPLE